MKCWLEGIPNPELGQHAFISVLSPASTGHQISGGEGCGQPEVLDAAASGSSLAGQRCSPANLGYRLARPQHLPPPHHSGDDTPAFAARPRQACSYLMLDTVSNVQRGSC